MESWSILIEFCALKPAHGSAPVQDTWFSNKKFLISCIIHCVIVISLARFTNSVSSQQVSADIMMCLMTNISAIKLSPEASNVANCR